MEADHGQLKRRLRPMRGLKTDQSGRIIIAGHAFIQNIRRGHYELGVDDAVTLRVNGRIQRAGPGNLTNPGINDLACLGFAKCDNAHRDAHGAILQPFCS